MAALPTVPACAAIAEVLLAGLGRMLSDPSMTMPAISHVLPAAIVYDLFLSPVALLLVAVVRGGPKPAHTLFPPRKKGQAPGLGAVRAAAGARVMTGSVPRLSFAGARPDALRSATPSAPIFRTSAPPLAPTFSGQSATAGRLRGAGGSGLRGQPLREAGGSALRGEALRGAGGSALRGQALRGAGGSGLRGEAFRGAGGSGLRGEAFRGAGGSALRGQALRGAGGSGLRGEAFRGGGGSGLRGEAFRGGGGSGLRGQALPGAGGSGLRDAGALRGSRWLRDSGPGGTSRGGGAVKGGEFRRDAGPAGGDWLRSRSWPGGRRAGRRDGVIGGSVLGGGVLGGGVGSYRNGGFAGALGPSLFAGADSRGPGRGWRRRGWPRRGGPRAGGHCVTRTATSTGAGWASGRAGGWARSARGPGKGWLRTGGPPAGGTGWPSGRKASPGKGWLKPSKPVARARRSSPGRGWLSRKPPRIMLQRKPSGLGDTRMGERR